MKTETKVKRRVSGRRRVPFRMIRYIEFTSAEAAEAWVSRAGKGFAVVPVQRTSWLVMSRRTDAARYGITVKPMLSH